MRRQIRDLGRAIDLAALVWHTRTQESFEGIVAFGKVGPLPEVFQALFDLFGAKRDDKGVGCLQIISL